MKFFVIQSTIVTIVLFSTAAFPGNFNDVDVSPQKVAQPTSTLSAAQIAAIGDIVDQQASIAKQIWAECARNIADDLSGGLFSAAAPQDTSDQSALDKANDFFGSKAVDFASQLAHKSKAVFHFGLAGVREVTSSVVGLGQIASVMMEKS